MSGYVKLFSSILDSTVWETPPATRIVWITMLAMADRDGVVEASVPGLAKRAGVERAECERAIALFLAPDPDSRTQDHEGRRIIVVDGGWQLLNYELYRDKATGEEKKKKAAERQARWRKRQADKAARERVTASRNAVDVTVTSVDQGDTLRSISDPAAAAAADPDQTREDAPAAPPEPEPQEPPELADLEPYAGLRARDVAQAWAQATAGQVFPGERRALPAFEAIAETIQRDAGEDSRLACWAWAHWVQLAPDGPKRRENGMKHPRPWSLQPGVLEDLPKVRAWFDALSDEDRERVSPPRGSPVATGPQIPTPGEARA